jgi:hypothetical protein
VSDVDKTALAMLLLEWGQKQEELETIEANIKECVLQLEKTQVVGDVRATYSKPRAKRDYEIAGKQAPKEIQDRHTTTSIVTKTDWKSICEDAEIEDIPTTYGNPSVTIKFDK